MPPDAGALVTVGNPRHLEPLPPHPYPQPAAAAAALHAPSPEPVDAAASPAAGDGAAAAGVGAAAALPAAAAAAASAFRCRLAGDGGWLALLAELVGGRPGPGGDLAGSATLASRAAMAARHLIVDPASRAALLRQRPQGADGGPGPAGRAAPAPGAALLAALVVAAAEPNKVRSPTRSAFLAGD
jgi:hypothetical protein